MIEIDVTKCTTCGICSDVCPAGVFVAETTPGKGRTMNVSFPDECTVCGHCVAACPQAAVIHGQMPIGQFPERPAASASPEEIRALLLSRRSVRSFEDRPVPADIISQLIEVGTYAGTASNAQTEGFVVVQDKRVLADVEKAVTEVLWRKIKPLGSSIGRAAARMKYGAELVKQSMAYYERFKRRRNEGRLQGTVFRNAPAVVMVHGLRSNFNAPANCAIAVRNMEIMAESMGLGTCWAGFLLVAAGFDKGIARRLSIPDNRNVYGAIMLGYPRHRYKRLIPRKEREVRRI